MTKDAHSIWSDGYSSTYLILEIGSLEDLYDVSRAQSLDICYTNLNLGSHSSKCNSGTEPTDACTNDSNLQGHGQVNDKSGVADGLSAVAQRLINKLLRLTDQQRKPFQRKANAEIGRLDKNSNPTAAPTSFREDKKQISHCILVDFGVSNFLQGLM
jgi:hypothetical protein